MQDYVLLGNFTQQGLQSFKDLPARLNDARELALALGGEIKGVYYTMGQFDAVAIISAPDDETASKMSLALGAKGNVRTQTLRAFNETQAQALAQSLRA